ncbi:peptidylprolyl isomerase [Aureimonas sp. ME7]|uniref:peptidylprolyl isomerase n=1 Tax=Aureimonas sp. ME7 TaxID=2744252 RepID=UPI0015F552FF|nr:peptidylprolyl isomerase [Aureimonas sp. ME7]
MKYLAAVGLALGVATLAASPSAFAQSADAKNTLVIETNKGEIDIALRPDLAPKHVAQIEALAKEGFYNGVVFHRVIDGFMAQTGDPTGTGMGGSKKPDLAAEFTDTPFKRGVVGMARAQDPNSANSQFFIMLADGDFLNGQYTVVGEVTKGMDVVDKIKKGSEANNGTVENPDKMLKVEVGGSGQ